ncbi:MAG TPA: phosphatase PAP2 family protein [Acidimicrobiales bacterium]|nr:phosphatase PAP2 family protein [Acidimicrobiales bacterium]
MTTTDSERQFGSDQSRGPTAPDDAAHPGGLTHQRERLSIRDWAVRCWSDPRRRRGSIGWAALAASVVVYFFVAGIPWSTNWVFIYITAGIVVSSLGTGVRWKRLLVDWLPFYLVLFVYSLLRDYASHTLWGPFVKPQIWFDAHVFGGLTPTVQLQEWLFSPALHVWDYPIWGCYMSHFFVSFIIAGVLWKTNHPRFRRFAALFVGLTFAGYVTYVLYPAMPPWMAYQTGHLGQVTRIIPVVLDHLHLHSGAAVFTGGNKFDNNVAAVPSIHGAYPMLICLFFWKAARVRKRILLAAYPLCMAFTLVYTGEHFVIDIFLGWLYAAAVFSFGSKLLNRWEARQLRRQLGQGSDHGAPAPLRRDGSDHIWVG